MYRRPVHLFQLSDATRIILKVNWQTGDVEKNFLEAFKIAKIVIQIIILKISDPLTDSNFLLKMAGEFAEVFLAPLRALANRLEFTLKRWLGF